VTTPSGIAPGKTPPRPDDGAEARVAEGRGPVPVRAEGVQLLGEMPGSGYRRPPALVRRTDGQTITLTPLLYLALKAMDGGRGYAELARLLSAATGRQIVTDDVSYLVEEKLRPLGLLAGPDGAQPQTSKMNPLLALRFKFVITDQTWTRRLTAPFAWFFRPVVAVGFVAGFLAFTWWLLVEKGLGSAIHQAFYEPGMILTLWVLVIGSGAFHEFGHAAACRYGGATPGAMGAGLYLVWPAFYTEVTDCYRLDRRGRLRVDLGGLYFNSIFAVAVLGLWAVTRWDALLLVAVAQHLQMVRQLAPFIRADGYHIIADVTGVPDLFAHIRPTLLGILPRRWRPAQPPALKRWARAVVVAWVLAVVPVLVGLVALGTLLLPRLAATAWDSMNLQWDAAGAYWGEGDLLGVGVRAVSSLIVCLPVLGLVYLLFRIARRCGRWAWRSTEDSPRGRVVVALAAAGIAVGVAWAWWPAGQYEPVHADERGSLSELVRMEERRIFIPLLERHGAAPPTMSTADDTSVTTTRAVVLGTAMLPAGPAAGPQSALLVVLSAEPFPSAVLPGEATTAWTFSTGDGSGEPGQVVLDESASQAWPFPFPPPEAPRDGDNHAAAVNTLDRSVMVDLAASWAIVTANDVHQRNEAWALASCEDCLTRAVAFQLLLLVGDIETVAPVNVAVAANYDCIRCTTEAIAVQLVMSLTGVPSAEAQQAVDEAIAELALLETDLAQLSGGQIYLVLRATEAEIVGILGDDGVILASATADIDISTAVPTTQADVAGTELIESTASAQVQPSGDSGQPSPSTSAESTTEPTSEPSGEPAPSPTSGSTEPSPTAEPTSEPSESGSTEPSPTAEPSTSSSP
jgi:putative peptide zinc metalloprotease protein